MKLILASLSIILLAGCGSFKDKKNDNHAPTARPKICKYLTKMVAASDLFDVRYGIQCVEGKLTAPFPNKNGGYDKIETEVDCLTDGRAYDEGKNLEIFDKECPKDKVKARCEGDGYTLYFYEDFNYPVGPDFFKKYCESYFGTVKL